MGISIFKRGKGNYGSSQTRVVKDDIFNFKIPTRTDQLVNTGENGLNKYITALDLYADSNGNGVISGDGMTWISDFDYEFSPYRFLINSNEYSTAIFPITLDASHPTLNRIDVLVGTFNALGEGIIEVIKGDELVTAIKPSINVETQIELTFVTINAGAVAPSVTNTLAYNENLQEVGGEFNTSTTDLIANVDLESGDQASVGTKSIMLNGGIALLTTTTPKLGLDISNLLVDVFLTEIVDDNSLQIVLLDSNGTALGGIYLVGGELNFDSGLLNQWQTISISGSALKLNGAWTTELYASIKLRNSLVGQPVYFDNVRVQEGLEETAEPNPTITNTSQLVNDGEDGVNPYITAGNFVPYTGATQDLDLGDRVLKVNAQINYKDEVTIDWYSSQDIFRINHHTFGELLKMDNALKMTYLNHDKIQTPNLSMTNINTVGNKSLITKEYGDSYYLGALAGYVPYSGATTDVDLGLRNITCQNTTWTDGTATFYTQIKNSLNWRILYNTNQMFDIGTNGDITLGNTLLGGRTRLYDSVEAPSFEIADISTVGAKALITKEYADANYLGAGTNIANTDLATTGVRTLTLGAFDMSIVGVGGTVNFRADGLELYGLDGVRITAGADTTYPAILYNNTLTVARSFTFPDKDGEIGLAGDIVTNHTGLTNIGVNTHAQIDAHIADATLHYTQASISITKSQVSDFGTYLTDLTTENLTTLSDVNLVTPINGQVLTYNNTTGDWENTTPAAGVTDHVLLSNIGVNTHAQIDTHIADATLHYTQASISITKSQVSDFGTYLTSETSHADVLIDGDFATSGIMKTNGAGVYSILTDNSTDWNTAHGWGDHSGLYETIDASILRSANIGVTVQAYNANTTTQGVITLASLGGTTNHTALSNIGTNTHAQIDTHIADATLHYTQASISITKSQVSDFGTYDNYSGWNLKTNGIQRTAILSGLNLDIVAGSDISVSYGAGGVVTIASTFTETSHTSINSHIADSSIHFTEASISITKSQVSDFGSYLALTGGTVSGATTFSNATASTSTATGAVIISAGGLGVSGAIFSGGNMNAPDFVGTSDVRLKENIEALTPKKLNTTYKTFNFKGNSQERVGVIAQELETENPEFVRTNEDGMKAVSYGDLHSAEIAYLKFEVERLANLVKQLM